MGRDNGHWVVVKVSSPRVRGEGITLGFVVKVNSLSLCVRGKQLIPLGNSLSLCVRGVSYRSIALAPAPKYRRPWTPPHPHAHTHTRTHPHARTHAKRNAKVNPSPTHTHTRTYLRAHAHARTHTHTRGHTCIFQTYHLPFVRFANVILVDALPKKSPDTHTKVDHSLQNCPYFVDWAWLILRSFFILHPPKPYLCPYQNKKNARFLKIIFVLYALQILHS